MSKCFHKNVPYFFFSNYLPSQQNIYQFSLFYFQVEGELFIVPDASHEFTLMISDYCELCSLLPSISVELGLRTAELMKFFNSRICQLIIGKNVRSLDLLLAKKI